MRALFSGLQGNIVQSSYLELSESEYRCGLAQSTHGHDPAYFTSVVDGAYDERIGSTTRAVDAGALLFHPAGEEHAVHFTAPRTRVFRLLLKPALLESARLGRVNFAVSLVRARAELTPLIDELRRAAARTDALAPIAIDALACEFVARAAQSRSRRSPNVAGAMRARDIIEAQLSRVPSLACLAEHANCHPVTLARAFRHAFGCSIGEYVRRRRLDVACTLLNEGALPLSMIAAQAGYADQAHLTRSAPSLHGRDTGPVARPPLVSHKTASRVQYGAIRAR